MMKETAIAKMNELINDEAFAQKIAEAGSYENAYQLFIDNGVEVSYEDYMAYIEDCRKAMIAEGLISEDGELSAEMLDTVSGGRWYHSLGAFALAGVAAYAGAPGAAVMLILVGIALWNKK